MRLVAAIALLLLTGCERDYAEVRCAGSGDGTLTCSVSHTKGSNTIDVCFDMVLQCHNGTTSSAHACQKSLAPNTLANRLLRDDDFKNMDKCDSVTGTSVSNIAITESK